MAVREGRRGPWKIKEKGVNNSTEGGWGPRTWRVTVRGLEQEGGDLKGPSSQRSQGSSHAK